jgi:hypothetical protein
VKIFPESGRLRRLEDLSGEFFAIAKRDKNHESAHLVARLNERIYAVRGFSPVNVRTDLQVEVAQQPHQFRPFLLDQFSHIVGDF